MMFDLWYCRFRNPFLANADADAILDKAIERGNSSLSLNLHLTKETLMVEYERRYYVSVASKDSEGCELTESHEERVEEALIFPLKSIAQYKLENCVPGLNLSIKFINPKNPTRRPLLISVDRSPTGDTDYDIGQLEEFKHALDLFMMRGVDADKAA